MCCASRVLIMSSSNANSSKYKRRDLSVQEKEEILNAYDDLPPMSQREAADRLKISQPMLSKLLKCRNELKSATLCNKNISRKRKRAGKDAEVENALLEWYQNAREKELLVNGPILCKQAEKLALQMGKANFVATPGWFHRFKKRHNLTYYRKGGGEQSDADDVPTAEKWMTEEWSKLIKDFLPEDIFNADETGLYYQALPETPFMFENENTKGSEIAKDRITILCCVSMTGRKRNLLVIGKNKNQRCFKNVKDLPVEYCANLNAWMTSELFKEWLLKWDRSLNRKILLLINKCLAHMVDVSLQHIQIVFLPTNTLLIQPLHQGIVQTLKTYYCKEMRRRLLLENDFIKTESSAEVCKKLDLLSALHLLRLAWNQVDETTVRNCFKKSGFTTESEPVVIECDFILPDDLAPTEFEKWMSIDERLQTTASTTESNICERIHAKKTTEVDDLLHDEEPEILPPSNQEVREALSIIRRAVQCNGNSDHFEIYYSYENFITNLIINKNL